MQIVYSRTAHPLTEGKNRKLQNPRFFTGPIEGATKVFIVGDYPEIAAAYRDAKVSVEVVDGDAAAAPTSFAMGRSAPEQPAEAPAEDKPVQHHRRAKHAPEPGTDA